jgi:hypothetical protein
MKNNIFKIIHIGFFSLAYASALVGCHGDGLTTPGSGQTSGNSTPLGGGLNQNASGGARQGGEENHTDPDEEGLTAYVEPVEDPVDPGVRVHAAVTADTLATLPTPLVSFYTTTSFKVINADGSEMEFPREEARFFAFNGKFVVIKDTPNNQPGNMKVFSTAPVDAVTHTRLPVFEHANVRAIQMNQQFVVYEVAVRTVIVARLDGSGEVFRQADGVQEFKISTNTIVFRLDPPEAPAVVVPAVIVGDGAAPVVVDQPAPVVQPTFPQALRNQRATGEIPLSVGDVRLMTGEIQFASGEVLLPNGNLRSAGEVLQRQRHGEFLRPNGEILQRDGNFRLPNGDVRLVDGTIRSAVINPRNVLRVVDLTGALIVEERDVTHVKVSPSSDLVAYVKNNRSVEGGIVLCAMVFRGRTDVIAQSDTRACTEHSFQLSDTFLVTREIHSEPVTRITGRIFRSTTVVAGEFRNVTRFRFFNSQGPVPVLNEAIDRWLIGERSADDSFDLRDLQLTNRHVLGTASTGNVYLWDAQTGVLLGSSNRPPAVASLSDRFLVLLTDRAAQESQLRITNLNPAVSPDRTAVITRVDGDSGAPWSVSPASVVHEVDPAVAAPARMEGVPFRIEIVGDQILYRGSDHQLHLGEFRAAVPRTRSTPETQAVFTERSLGAYDTQESIGLNGRVLY